MANETIVLDPSEVAATGRSAIDITPWLDQAGIDWGDAQVEEFLADMDRGSSPVDVRFPNRQVQGGLMFSQTLGGTTTATARAMIGRKLAMFQREGGTLKRITNSGSVVYADVVSSTFHATSVSGVDSRASRDPEASFSLECIPDFYGDEITLADHVNTTGNELVFTETGILGDYPGRCRVVVDNDEASADFLGLMYAFRSRNYSSATTAKTFYEAEAGQALDTARILALSGASGGTAITHGTISTSWTPVYGTNLGGTAFLTHQGSYRLRARVYSTSGTLVQTRAVYDVGDLISPAENDPVRLPGASNFYIVDYGELRLDPVGQGTHRWQGQIQARGDVGTENFSVDEIYLLPLDETAATGSTVPAASVTQGLAAYSARDEFNQTAGNLGGKSAPIGGIWTTGGAATDFAVETSGVTAQRSTTADASQRTASLPLSLATAAASIDFKWSALPTTASSSMNTYLNIRGTSLQAVVQTAVSGGVTVTKFMGTNIGPLIPGVWYTLRLRAFGTIVVGELGFQGASALYRVFGSDSSGAGTVGFSDQNTSATAITRNYKNFITWVPSADAVIFASRSAQLTTDGAIRQEGTGTAYGPVIPAGDNLRIPPSGNEGRTIEMFLKPSRGDFAAVADAGLNDDFSARVFYRPSYLFAP